MTTQLRSNFLDFFTESKLPALEKVVTAIRDRYPSMIDVIFNREKMNSDIYQTTTMSGLRNPTIKAEGQPVTFNEMKPGFKKTYEYVEYANAYRISRQMVRDGKISMISRATESFAKGFAEVWELEAASIFDDGFTVNGYDGVPLLSTAHPLENGDGLTGANKPVTASELSKTSYRELRNIAQNTLNEDGQLARYMLQYLVLPQALQDVGKELLGSAYDPENANNTINSIYEHTTLLPGGYWAYLGSDTAWFMVSPKNQHDLMFLDRAAFETDSDYDKHAFCYELIASESRAWGYSGWRGVYGNAGA